MIDKLKEQKKGFISEDDISTVLQRYKATTVLALLQEVAQAQDVKIDWNALVTNTTTGISNPREYQMLWRHLAYRDALLDKFDDVAKPLDDDSDLEYELEAFPSVSCEASAEAAACVKVMIASGLPNDANLQKGLTVEAPLTINIPNGQPARASPENSQLAATSMKGTNITVPVSVQKQLLPMVPSTEGFDASGSAGGSLPARRKRKPWSTAEDMELIAAVEKCGEGNWANILKGDFKGDRTASQLSQRWAIIRKRHGNLNARSGSQLSEAQLAARRAVSLALNMPMGDNLKSAASTGTNSNAIASHSKQPSTTVNESPTLHTKNQSQQDSTPTPPPQRIGNSASLSKSRVNSKKPSTRPKLLGPDDMVKAAAVAAGARIATPSDAASILKAAQRKNAVHIIPGGGGSLIKPSVANSSNPLSSSHLGSHPNVHYIRTGLVSNRLSTFSRQGNGAKPVGPAVQIGGNHESKLGPANFGIGTHESNVLTEAEANNGTVRNAKVVPKGRAAFAGSIEKENIRKNQPALLGKEKERAREGKASVSGSVLKDNDEETKDSVVGSSSNKRLQADSPVLPSESTARHPVGSPAGSKLPSNVDVAQIDENKNGYNKVSLLVKDGDDNQSENMDICEDQSDSQKQEDSHT